MFGNVINISLLGRSITPSWYILYTVRRTQPNRYPSRYVFPIVQFTLSVDGKSSTLHMSVLQGSPGTESTLSCTSDDTLIDDPSHSFFTFISISVYSFPSLPRTQSALFLAIIDAFNHLEHSCEVCYFLQKRRPIGLVQPGWAGEWVWVGQDNHIFEAHKCPWWLLHPLVLYEDFALEVQDSMRQPCLGDKELAICARCGEPRDAAEPHPCCLYGPSLFMITFMIWRARPIHDRVFSFLLLCSSISIPDLGSRSEYAEWLGFPITPGSSLRHIHLVIVAYHLLQANDLLPSYVFL